MAATGDAPPRKRAKPAAQTSSVSMYETGGTASLTPPQKAQLAEYIQQQAAYAGLTSLTLAQQSTLEQQYLRLLSDHIQQQRALQLQYQQQQQQQAQAKARAVAAKVKPAPPPKQDFPCALCPDTNSEGLVPIGETSSKVKKQAHRLCVSCFSHRLHHFSSKLTRSAYFSSSVCRSCSLVSALSLIPRRIGTKALCE
jgi:hypothetical protein